MSFIFIWSEPCATYLVTTAVLEFSRLEKLNCRQHESVWPIKWCCPAHLLFALRRFRKTSKWPLYHICLVRFLRTHMPQCKGTFSDFCKSVRLLFMCLCVCMSVCLRYRTGQALCHIKYPSPVDLTTGGDEWNAISVPFQEHRKWEFWKCRNKIFLTLWKLLEKQIKNYHSQHRGQVNFARYTGCDRTWQGMWYCLLKVFDDMLYKWYQISLVVKRFKRNMMIKCFT